MSTIPLAVAALLVTSTATPTPPAEACRAAAGAYFEAITLGDADAALALVEHPSEADRITVRASAASARGLRRLEELAQSRFGQRGDVGISVRHRRLLDAIKRATVELHDDRAVLRPERERPVRLRWIDGAWKVESPAKRLTGEERRALRDALRKTENATRDLAERIHSGAVKSAQEVRDALRKALGRNEEEGVPL
ncbi:MAG TPA: hypothetical protein VEM76_08570 [Anaeromyxobacteraceae bacterium]|nr:hypothetical protein [Anaeromyxobacteraceae bacterium]